MTIEAEKPVDSWSKVWFQVHPDVHQALKLASVVGRTTMRKLVDEALREKLGIPHEKKNRGRVKKTARRRNAG